MSPERRRTPSPPNDELKSKQFKLKNREVAAQKALLIIGKCKPDDEPAPRPSQTQKLNYVKDSVQHAIHIRLKGLRNARSRRLSMQINACEEEQDDDDDDADDADDDDDENKEDERDQVENMPEDDEEDDEEEEDDLPDPEEEKELPACEDDVDADVDVVETEVGVEEEEEVPDDDAASTVIGTVASNSREAKTQWQSNRLECVAFAHCEDTGDAARAICDYLNTLGFDIHIDRFRGNSL